MSIATLKVEFDTDGEPAVYKDMEVLGGKLVGIAWGDIDEWYKNDIKHIIRENLGFISGSFDCMEDMGSYCLAQVVVDICENFGIKDEVITNDNDD